MNIMNGQFPSIEQVTDNYLKQPGAKKTETGSGERSFADVFVNAAVNCFTCLRNESRTQRSPENHFLSEIQYDFSRLF